MFDFDCAAIAAAANADPAFAQAARFWSAAVSLDLGGEAYRLEIEDGRVVAFRTASPGDRRAEIALGGPAEAWEKLLSAVPPAPYDDIRFGGPAVGFTVEADVVAALAPYYGAIQEFVAVLRRARSGLPPAAAVPEGERGLDATIGRYRHLRIGGVQYRVYVEEAGDGPIPLLLQHTAGADGRQWRHLLEDPDLQRRCRMIAYDLPYHGKSLPPTGVRWWEEEYRLGRGFLIDCVQAVGAALGLDRPAFMGCSIGGHLAADLAYYAPDAFRAVIGINSGLGIDSTKRNVETEESWAHPRVGAQWRAAAMIGNTAPTSPETYRRETGWIYSQGAPGVLKGDVYYYSQDHDLTEAQARAIDTGKVAVYFVTGEYDPLAAETGTARLAGLVRGSRFQLVPGLGHFGPAENPAAFKPVLLPILDEIARLF